MNNWLWIILVILCLLVIISIQKILMTVTVWGNSMHPLLSHGDRVLVLRYYPSSFLKLNQIVVGMLAPHHIGSPSGELASVKALFIKKIIGLPKDTVTISSSALHKSMRVNASVKRNNKGNFVWVVPEGYFFVRGEAPINGDSITWGPIPLESLIGIVLFKWTSQANLTDVPPPIPGYPSFQRPTQIKSPMQSKQS